MKNLILTVICTVLCAIAFCQSQKPVSPKKTNTDTISNSLLKQEKYWPVFYKYSKNRGNAGIKSAADFTGTRL
jgi:hypothetical protein